MHFHCHVTDQFSTYIYVIAGLSLKDPVASNVLEDMIRWQMLAYVSVMVHRGTYRQRKICICE